MILAKITNILSQMHVIVFGGDFELELAPPSLTTWPDGPIMVKQGGCTRRGDSCLKLAGFEMHSLFTHGGTRVFFFEELGSCKLCGFSSCLIFRQPEPAHNIEFGYDADKTVSLVAIINKKETFYEEKIKTFVSFFFTKKRILRFGRPNLIIDPNQQSTILININ